jgi:hypothetical protein
MNLYYYTISYVQYRHKVETRAISPALSVADFDSEKS